MVSWSAQVWEARQNWEPSVERFAGKEDLLTARYLDHHMTTILTMVYEYHTNLDYLPTIMSALMLTYHLVQVCYPSLLVTPQHWSRVPHARSEDHFYISPPQLHLGKGSVTPGTRFCSDAHLLLFIQRALKSDPVSLTCANLYKGRATFSKLCLKLIANAKSLCF